MNPINNIIPQTPQTQQTDVQSNMAETCTIYRLQRHGGIPFPPQTYPLVHSKYEMMSRICEIIHDDVIHHHKKTIHFTCVSHDSITICLFDIMSHLNTCHGIDIDVAMYSFRKIAIYKNKNKHDNAAAIPIFPIYSAIAALCSALYKNWIAKDMYKYVVEFDYRDE